MLLAGVELAPGYGHLRRCVWLAVLMPGALLAWLGLGLSVGRQQKPAP
jgi:hypothetical protein